MRRGGERAGARRRGSLRVRPALGGAGGGAAGGRAKGGVTVPRPSGGRRGQCTPAAARGRACWRRRRAAAAGMAWSCVAMPRPPIAAARPRDAVALLVSGGQQCADAAVARRDLCRQFEHARRRHRRRAHPPSPAPPLRRRLAVVDHSITSPSTVHSCARARDPVGTPYCPQNWISILVATTPGQL